jgi:hypothetical protein
MFILKLKPSLSSRSGEAEMHCMWPYSTGVGRPAAESHMQDVQVSNNVSQDCHSKTVSAHGRLFFWKPTVVVHEMAFLEKIHRPAL